MSLALVRKSANNCKEIYRCVQTGVSRADLYGVLEDLSVTYESLVEARSGL